MKLPIDSLMPQILGILEKENALILKASPGAGKTTRVPQALMQGHPKKIFVLEPRRLAAKFAATRVSQELRTEIGKDVGYEFRFERKTSRDTQLTFLTEGLLMKKILSQPDLKEVGMVILDEFHERSLNADLALAYLRRLQTSTRPDLKILVMSATMELGPVSQFLGNAKILEQELPPHPVELLHLDLEDQFLEKKCFKAAQAALDSKYTGDILVFLPGMAEIRRTESHLNEKRLPGIKTYVLHGEISQKEQEEAIYPQKGIRKIILSTNIAETSLTIEGVNIVIDSGLEKRAVVDEWTQVTELLTKKISQASARQRTGRAARMGPGMCIRLYSKPQFDALLPFTPPEIQRGDLSKTYLELLTLGVKDISTFQWFESPRQNLIEGAAQLLESLGAISDRNTLTPLGKAMSDIPAHPRLASLILEAQKEGCFDDVAWIAAALMEGQLPRGNIFYILNQIKGSFALKRAFEQLKSSVGEKGGTKAGETEITNCLLTGFPDRVAKRKEEKNARFTEYVLSSGGTAQIESKEAPHSEYLLILEAKKQDSGRTFIHTYVELDQEQIFDQFSDKLKETVALSWDKEKERMICLSKLTYGNLSLMESKQAPPSDERAAKFLLEEGLGIRSNELLPLREILEKAARIFSPEILESQLTRIELFSQIDKEITLPDSKAFLAFLLTKSKGSFSLQDLKQIDWKSEVLFHFLGNKAYELDQKIPEVLSLANGKKMKLTYSLGNQPKCSLKIQELFGLKDVPKLMGGKISILLEILGPNYRPVQTTSDLAGFWERSYPALRKELSRKYPRHKWPENPILGK